MELYKKYRPQTLDDIKGNKVVVQTLKGYDELPHSILLVGNPGCGKTTIGRIIAHDMLGCKGIDYKELDSAVFRGIDTVREVRKQMQYSAVESDCRVWLIDEVHMLGTGGNSPKNAAQQALLKSLEDTPEHVYFILCTTNPEMLIPTIKDRCTTLKVENLSDDSMGSLLKDITKQEEKRLYKKVKQQIIQDAQGHPRRALKVLEKVLCLDDKRLMLKAAVAEGIKVSKTNELCQALLKGFEWKKVSKILKGLKAESPENIRQSVMGYLTAGILDQWAFNYSFDPGYIISWFYDKNTYDTGFNGIVFCCYCISEEVESPYI